MSTSPDRRRWFGQMAVAAGTPDYSENDEETNVVDALANVFHYAASKGFDVAHLVDRAFDHFETELSELCSQCGDSLADGEGWDGLCGSCADRAEHDKEAPDDH